jgi:hypothetical protein
MRRLGQHRNPPPALPDGALPVPHQHPRHPAELVEELPPAGKQVLGHPRRQQPRGQPAGIAGHHHQHRQPGRRAGLAEPHRQGDIGKPQVALGHLPSRIRRPRRRVRWQIHRAQLPHAVLEHRQRPGPADPLGDHRGRHRRPRRQQLPDPRLGRIHDRPSRRPRIPRWAILGQRPLHRILGDPHHPRDRLDRHLLGPAQPTDLRPVLHVQHPRFLPGSTPARVQKGSTLRRRLGVSFHAPSTQRPPCASPIAQRQQPNARSLSLAGPPRGPARGDRRTPPDARAPGSPAGWQTRHRRATLGPAACSGSDGSSRRARPR